MAVPSYLHLNLFRVVADLAHILSKCILIWSIHWNRSAEGKLGFLYVGCLLLVIEHILSII